MIGKWYTHANEAVRWRCEMLNLIFQKAKAKDISKVRVDSRAFFAREKKADWFTDPFVRQVM